MNTFKRKSVRTILAAVLGTSMVLLAACSNSSNNGAEAGNSDYGNPTDGYKNNLNISIASTIKTANSDFDNEFHKYFTDKFNIKWDYNYVEWDSWAEKLRLWINSGDLPDVASWNYVHGDALNYIDQGLLYKLPDNWKERWPNVAAAYKLTGLGDKLEELVGGTYVLPRPVYNENKPADPLVNQIGVIALRSDWAKAVGFPIKDAYTTSELMDFARLLKEKDPGKVGANLVPISYDVNDALTNIIMANSAHSRVESAFYKDADGKYQWGPANQETLTGLKDLQQAYKEGLLHPEFYTWKNGEANQKFNVNGVSGITSLGGLASYRKDMDQRMKDNLGLNSDDVVHTAIVLGDDGKYRNLEQVNFWSAVIFSPNISKEKFERIMDFMEYTTAKEGNLIVNMGFEGKDWKYGENQELESLLPEGQTLDKKYPNRFEGLYVLADDFSIVNPGIKKEYRERSVQLFKEKAELGMKDKSLADYDWDFQLYDSKAKNQASFDYATEYTNLILQPGDLEKNWKDWVNSKMSLVQPVLDELNNLKK
ncbi:extracellular solute-binding protein [Paenibacillus agri]|uniref:Extracellular solute-binding protein n=1 Tax=Paenibacillus agri TaxID=2744309 RepID=A0A850EJ42_9BACL|nr:extracellular solute-binding protein [Paenibacillus agri]NUU60396.1 extracellular solute-binding protein [Paenibacillus agri]